MERPQYPVERRTTRLVSKREGPRYVSRARRGPSLCRATGATGPSEYQSNHTLKG